MIIREIGIIARSLDSIANIEFRDVQLAKGQYAYLVRVFENPGIIQEELSEMLKVDRSTVARSVQKLEKNGLIERTFSSENKKNKMLFVTEEGHRLAQFLLREHRYSEAQAVAGLSAEEQEILESLLSKVRSNIVKDWEAVKKGEKRNY